MLQTLGSDETLDAGSLGIGFLAFALGLDLASDDELADLRTHKHISAPMSSHNNVQRHGFHFTHIIILRQAKELPDLRRPLRPQPLRMHRVRQARQLALALLDNRQRQHRQIHAHDAAPHALAFPLAGPTRTVAAVAVTQQQPHPGGVHDALLHGETLLVVAAGDLEDVALEFGPEVVAGDLLAHAAVHEHAEFALIFDFDELLRAVGGVGDVELHLDGGGLVRMGGFVLGVVRLWILGYAKFGGLGMHTSASRLG